MMTMMKAEAREARLRLEAEGLAATSRLRKLYTSLNDTLFRGDDVRSDTSFRLSGPADVLSRLGLIDELNDLEKLIKGKGTERPPRSKRKWFVSNIAHSRMQTWVARRDYEQGMLSLPTKNGRYTLFLGAIYQGDLDDAHAMLRDAVSRRESPDAFPDLQAVYCAGRLAIVAHWQGNSSLAESALQIMRCFLEQKPLSTRPLDEDNNWIPTQSGFESYYIVTLASAGFPALAETIWNRLDENGRTSIRHELCKHLAMAGKQERAFRIARQGDSDESPSHLFKPLCHHAAQSGDLDTASRFADEYFASVHDQAQNLKRLSNSFDQLYEFIRWLKRANQSDLANRAVRAYIELADRGATENDADIRRSFALHSGTHFVGFKDILSASELTEFAHRQSQFVISQLDIEDYADKERIAEWRLALAQIGEIPTDVPDLLIQQQVPIVIALLDAGHGDEALQIYRPIVDWAVKPLSTDPDTTVSPGRVTRSRYAMAQLGPYFDDVEIAMKCVEQLQASDSSTDYRRNGAVHIDYQLSTRIPRSLAHAKGLDVATDWAESLTDKDKQLRACAVLLDIATEHIGTASDYKRTSIAAELGRIDPSYMIAVGC